MRGGRIKRVEMSGAEWSSSSAHEASSAVTAHVKKILETPTA